MSLDFKPFRNELEYHFNNMCKVNTHLFEIDLDKDKFWNLYLDSIPAEHNPIFQTRREFDCSCCRQFFKGIGNVVN